jgi:hypothetical protein
MEGGRSDAVRLCEAEAKAKEVKGLLLAYFPWELVKDPSNVENMVGGSE